MSDCINYCDSDFHCVGWTYAKRLCFTFNNVTVKLYDFEENRKNVYAWKGHLIELQGN